MHAKATTGARGAFLGPRVDFKTFNAKACKGLCSRFSVQPSGLSPGARSCFAAYRIKDALAPVLP